MHNQPFFLAPLFLVLNQHTDIIKSFTIAERVVKLLVFLATKVLGCRGLSNVAVRGAALALVFIWIFV